MLIKEFTHNLKDRLRRKGRSLDADLRYFPVVNFLKTMYQSGEKILEVGSGDYGITPYFPVPIIGVDISEAFTENTSPLVEKSVIQGVELPFPDKSYDYALSVDMLEHVNQEQREVAIAEMIRVAKKYVIFTVPTGNLSEAQDRVLYRYYEKQYGKPYQFLVEHLEYGLPTNSKLVEVINHHDRVKDVRIFKNVNLKIREIYMKTWMTRGLMPKIVFKGLSYLDFLSPFLNFGNCYRSIFIINLNE